MRNIAHPMSGLVYKQKNQLGGWLDDLKESAEAKYDSFKESYIDPAEDWLTETARDAGVSEAEINKIKQEAAQAGEQELNKQLQELAAQATGSSGGFKPSSTMTNIQNQIDELNKSAVFSYIPGGLYTVMGVAGAGLVYLLLTRD